LGCLWEVRVARRVLGVALPHECRGIVIGRVMDGDCVAALATRIVRLPTRIPHRPYAVYAPAVPASPFAMIFFVPRCHESPFFEIVVFNCPTSLNNHAFVSADVVIINPLCYVTREHVVLLLKNHGIR